MSVNSWSLHDTDIRSRHLKSTRNCLTERRTRRCWLVWFLPIVNNASNAISFPDSFIRFICVNAQISFQGNEANMCGICTAKDGWYEIYESLNISLWSLIIAERTQSKTISVLFKLTFFLIFHLEKEVESVNKYSPNLKWPRKSWNENAEKKFNKSDDL